MVGAIVGGAAGAIVFGVFVAFGLVVTSRVANPIPLVVLAVAGAYAGWLLGVVVFGAVRAAGEADEGT